MRYLSLFSILFLLTISSCNQLYRAIPKAPKHKHVLTESEFQNKQLEPEITSIEILPIENKNGIISEIKVNETQSDESKLNLENEVAKEIKRPTLNNSKSTIKDTLYVDADVLEEGESCVRLQTVVNVGTSLMFILFFFSAIFIVFGVYNIYRYNNLPYVTQETDSKMQRKIRNFYIALGLYLFLILLIVAMIIIL